MKTKIKLKAETIEDITGGLCKLTKDRPREVFSIIQAILRNCDITGDERDKLKEIRAEALCNFHKL